MAKLDERVKFPHGVSAEWFRRMNNPKYLTHFDNFLQKPGIHADATSTSEAVNAIVNRNWGLSGQGALTSLVTYAITGGITLTTDTTTDDEFVVVPHTTSGGMLADGNWSTLREPYIQINLLTAAAITNEFILAGFGDATKTAATDSDNFFTSQADGFWLLYATDDATSTANWVSVSTRASTETRKDSGVVAAVSTLYRLELWLDSDRVPHYYINGTKVCTADTTALTTAIVDIYPMFAIHALTTAPVACTVRNVTVSQLYG